MTESPIPPNDVDSDQDVISRVLGGDRDAFAVLIGRYSDPLYRHALGMTGSADVAEDILQVSFIKAYHHLAEVRGRSYEEMADLLGTTVGALKMRVHRAREALQALLEEKYA